MLKSYRLKTEVGVDKEVRINIEQDFDFLEILSLKLRQEDLYDRFCADYGIVVGRVVANGGFGVPNATISVFVPLDSVDENNPVISTLYPYKNLKTKSDDGYRYNLLPYKKEYGGHTPTGTFPDREDVLTRKEVLQVYEKYYKYTVKTNESGDFMIVGVPVGQHKLVMDLDLSNMGQFSLRPADLVRMGRGVPTQFNGQNFKASEDLDSLPQIVNSVTEIEVTPFWGENDICDVGITRSDFDLRDLGIEIQPQAVFMGSLFSSTEDDFLKGNCKPKNDLGKLCDTVAGPGQILALRQTIDVDSEGQPIIEQHFLEEGGNVIDDNGAWMVDLPMNIDYVTTNEFGEQVISLDPTVGIPTKGRYRFRIKYQNESGLKSDIIRADYLIPNIREHGWTGTTIEDIPENQAERRAYLETLIPTDEERNKSYAFSLNWDDYHDKIAAINCEDSFYQFSYNKVYTVASHLDRFKWGRNRIKHLGIKEINDKTCQSENNPLPVNDAQRNGSVLIFLFNFLISILTLPLITLLVVAHVITLIWPLVRAIIIVIKTIINFVLYGICLIIALFSRKKTRDDCVRKEITPPPKESPFSNVTLPMLSYPDCEACACDSGVPETDDSDTASQLESYADEENFGPIIDASYTPTYEIQTGCGPVNCDTCDNEEGDTIENSEGTSSAEYREFQGRLLGAGYDQYDSNGFYKTQIKNVSDGVDLCGNWDVARSFNTNDQVQWYKSPVYQTTKSSARRLRWKAGIHPTYAQALNLLNRRALYFGEANIATNVTDVNGNTGADDKFVLPKPDFANARKTTTAIKATMKNNQLGFNAPETSWYDNVFIMVLDPKENLDNGQLFFFNNPQNINDPNFNTFPDGNQFDGTGITGTCEGSTTDYIYREFKSIDPLNNETTNGVWLYNTATTMDYKFKSGVEYFQVIKTYSSYDIWQKAIVQAPTEKKIQGYKGELGDPLTTYDVTASVLWRYIVDYRQNYKTDWDAPGGVSDENLNMGDSIRIPGNDNITDFSDVRIAVCVRGVDPYMPRQRIKYDLSKLFGRGPDGIVNFDDTITVEGDYLMNIPIQSNESGGDMYNVNAWRNSARSAIAHHRLWTQDGNKRDNLYFHNSDNNGAWYYENNTLAYSAFNTRLFHKPFLFEVDNNLWQEWNSYTPSKYVSNDKQFSDIDSETFEYWMGSYGQGIHAPNGQSQNLSPAGAGADTWQFPFVGINPWYQQSIEGIGYQCSWIGSNSENTTKDQRRHRINGPTDVFTMSPLYLPSDYEDGDESQGVPHVKMKNSQKLLFRSDRTPSSDKFDEPEYGIFHRKKKKGFRRYALHLNLKQQLYLTDDDGTVTDITGSIVPTDASGAYEDMIEDTNCETSLLLSSFNCDGMVPLGCYSGDGENFGIEQPCDIPLDLEFNIQGDQRLKNGCYAFVIKKPVKSLRADIEMLFEYRTRMRFMFAVCQGVIGESFQNNWLNGTLYMPTFQKQTLYGSENEVKRYRYCGDPQQPFAALRRQGPIYFNTDTNSFYYRSTPFDDNTNQFVGQVPSRDYYYGQNLKNIWFPTTIMELGPRDEFTKEIAFSPEFEGYIIDTLKSTSYQNPTDVVNLFLLSRLANTSFLEQFSNTGDASIGQLFSRADGTALSRFFDARVDGDFSQMVGINSEYGVVPFLDGNYCDDAITVQDDRFGIWFSSNTIDRRILTNGTTTFGTNPEGPDNYFGYPKTQIVPYYMWYINNNGLFGTEYNNWQTEYIFSSKYQGDDFFEGGQPYMKPNYGYGRGHIFNKSAVDPEYDSYPINNENSNNFKVGSPFYFYFGLKRGKSAMNRYIKKYIFNL
jgi:hypothetical protein